MMEQYRKLWRMLPMAEKKKILYIVEAMGGGVFTYIVDLANELVNSYDMYIAYAVRKQTPQNYKDYFDKRIHLIEVKNFGRVIDPAKDIAAFFEVKKIAAKIKPDVIHLHSSKAGAIGRVAFNGKIPMFYTPHGYSFLMENYKPMKRRMFKVIESVCAKRNCTTISCSVGEHQESLKLTKHATYVNNGINMAELQEIIDKTEKVEHPFTVPSNVEKHWYTLEFCNSNQVRAAYAPSFGVDRIEDSKLNAYKQFLSLFDYLSVREISGQKIIKKILEKDVPVVLDPTLLLERNYWDRLLKEATVCIPKQPYCFCYFLGNNKKHRESVKHLSQHKDYKIVNLQHFSGFCEADVDFADENLYAVSPQDFIALIANADYVCTDSFHCTAFSIQYEKNFTVFHRFEKKDKNSTNTRLYSLLEQLNLGTRIIDDGQDIIPNAVDYSICNNLLEKQRVISSEYLQEALRARKKF